MIVIHKHIIPKWQIANHENYVFASDKKLYNISRGKEVKPVLKGYTIGYNIAGKFMSRKQIKPMLKKYKDNYCPF